MEVSGLITNGDTFEMLPKYISVANDLVNYIFSQYWIHYSAP